MRPIWKGTITFGLVTIPVGLYSDDRDPRFRSAVDIDVAYFETPYWLAA